MADGSVEIEEVLDYPEEVPDVGLLAGLFEKLAAECCPGVFVNLDPSAGKDPVPVLIRLGQKDVPVVNREAGDPVFEAYAILVEGDHGAGEFIRRRVKRI